MNLNRYYWILIHSLILTVMIVKCQFKNQQGNLKSYFSHTYNQKSFRDVQKSLVSNFNQKQQEAIIQKQLQKQWSLVRIFGTQNSYGSFRIVAWSNQNPNDSFDVVSYSIITFNHWETDDTYQILYRLNNLKYQNPSKKITFVDIGANIGWFTLAIASRGYNVQAFEPFIDNRNALKESIKINQGFDQLITLNEVALGEQNQTCSLYSEKENVLNGNIRCDQSKAIGINRGEVLIKTLDSFINAIDENTILGVLKIDTEGFEYFVFKGGQEFLKKFKIPYMIMEFQPELMISQGYTPDEHLQLLQSIGYECHTGGFEGPIVKQFSEFKHLFDSINLITLYAVFNKN